MEIDNDLNPGPELVRVHSTIIHQIHWVPIKMDIATTCWLPSASIFERASTPGDDSVARQRILVGNALNDEQRSDGLSNSSSDCVQRSRSRTWLREDQQEKIRSGASVTPCPND